MVEGNADVCFTEKGFCNWKTAMEKDRGFGKHASSTAHQKAMQAWMERSSREANSATIRQHLSSSQIERNRYYIKSMAEVVQFLAVNELAFRGNKECGNDNAESHENVGGLFNKLFEFAMSKDDKLRKISLTMPQNAKYMSPLIQNEVIDLLAKMVQDAIVCECKNSDIEWYSIKCDETRDSCNVEDMSIVIRYVINGKPVEHMIAMIKVAEVDANSLTQSLLGELQKLDLDPAHILSQCYDGASVMSGAKGGVQKIVQGRLKRIIPYVHCYNHQLHLVVAHAMEAEPKMRNFFNLCEHLYVFFRRNAVANTYGGETLKRLLVQRWTGHYQSAVVVKNNRDEILRTLEILANNENSPSDISVEAAGLLTKVSKPEFQFLAVAAVKILALLSPANSMLQGRSCNVSLAMELIQTAKQSIVELRSEDGFMEMADAAGLIAEAYTEHQTPKRQRTQSHWLTGSVVSSTLGHDHIVGQSSDTMKRVFFHVLDSVHGEMEHRFGEANQPLFRAVGSLVPSSDNFLEEKSVQTLSQLLGIDKDGLAGELPIAAQMCRKKLQHGSTLEEATLIMRQFRDAFPSVYQLYAGALTIGVSTATCESSFSTLTRVLRPYRRSMGHERKTQLVLLAFEKALTLNIKFDDFLERFASKSRRIVL